MELHRNVVSSYCIEKIKGELYRANLQCSLRGLKKTAKWHAELIYALDQVQLPGVTVYENINPSLYTEFYDEYDKYIIAKSYFDCEEYSRAAYFTSTCKSHIVKFLHYYSIYLAGEKKKVDDEISISTPELNCDVHLKSLYVDLTKECKENKLDSFGLYLLGVVLKKLEKQTEAMEKFAECVSGDPLNWGAWLELSKIVPNRQALRSLSIPRTHWMYDIFIAQFYLELQHSEQALECFQLLLNNYFKNSTSILAKKALAHHNLRDVDLAIAAYNKLQQMDPFRLDNMDTYSNLLYIRELKPELAQLAHHCAEIDRYRVETCCVIGNYYSLHNQHDKAVMYFQRAIKLDPNYLSAWTLMGHEFMELKSTSAAILAYRKAIDVNKKDYRAWYGLGQTYEILKMPFYSLYYYRQAHLLRPNDSRMAVALGEAYDYLGRLHEAKRCYWKARSLGDIEGLALIKLARLYERLNEHMQAAGAYTTYINETKEQLLSDGHGQAYKFLANYHLKRENLEEAFDAAQKCIEFVDVKEEGKALLRQISDLRGKKSEQVSKESQPTPLQLEDNAEELCSPMSLTFTY
ncbi:hypothetical protein HELRODRAFT_96551 [Helobdella robusta]|uniref:Cdc23 domain-containing protein n=1 Tax=Helobdella robusta TaxID=6412 RepID=T1G9C8_HELRO|nr:hypothetical protein HELRODRAFT_96551 [Helobdella robusta]ESN90559.1 hypothetical protein HELRODRAFT_96551 [Helobdella robusta]